LASLIFYIESFTRGKGISADPDLKSFRKWRGKTLLALTTGHLYSSVSRTGAIARGDMVAQRCAAPSSDTGVATELETSCAESTPCPHVPPAPGHPCQGMTEVLDTSSPFSLLCVGFILTVRRPRRRKDTCPAHELPASLQFQIVPSSCCLYFQQRFLFSSGDRNTFCASQKPLSLVWLGLCSQNCVSTSKTSAWELILWF